MFSRTELAEAYQCCVITMRRRLRAAGITHRLLITPIEFYQFQQKYGAPRNPKALIGA